MDELTLLRELVVDEPIDDEAARAEVWRRLLEGETSLDHEQAARRRKGRRRRRWALVAVAAALLAGVLLVTPAFGIGNRLLSFIQGAPAPPEVQAYFAANDEYREKMLAYSERAGERLYLYSWPVMTRAARGVFAIESPDGPIYLWSAPTEDGRRCSLIQTGTEAATGHLSCDGAGDPVLKAEVLSTPERPSVWIVHARVAAGAITRVEIEVDGGPNVSLPVVAGYGFGIVPKTSRIVAFVGENAEGDKVVTQR